MTDTIDLGATVDQTGVTNRPDVNTGNLGVFGTIGVNGYNAGTIGSTGTLRFDLAGMNICTLTTGTPATLSFTAPSKTNSTVYLKIIQPASGTPTTVVFPVSVLGSPPQPTAVLGAVTLYPLFWDGTNYYYTAGTSTNVTTSSGGSINVYMA